MPQWTIRRVERTGSTNADLAELARDGAPDGTAVVADHQDAGRGRLGRVWHTPAGTALTVSFLVRPSAVATSLWSWLPLLTGVAVVDAIASASGVEARLKWPNDVLIGNKKVAGILVERVDTPDGSAAVIGVGLNVSQTAADLPDGATSLEHETSSRIVVNDVLEVLAAHLDAGYERWRADGGDPHAELAASYTKYCVTIGQQVRADLPGGGTLTGLAVGIDDLGRLVIEHGSDRTPVGAGDIIHVRPSV